MSNKNIPLEENEILSFEDEKIRQMLGDLKRIDAPNDFDFRLKARIASAKPQDFQAPRLFPILRYAAPLGLAIIVLAVIVVSGLYSYNKESVASVNENPDKLKVNIVLPDNSEPEQFVAAGNSRTKDNVNSATDLVYKEEKKEINPLLPRLVANAANPTIPSPKKANTDIRFKDSAITEANVLLPDGFGSNNSYSVKPILSINGIDADFSNKKWKVKSIAQNSIAERSGVKVDDVIEAIDDIKLSAETINSKGKLNVGKLTVVRESKKLEIILQNK